MFSIFVRGFRDGLADSLAALHVVVVCGSLVGLPAAFLCPWLWPVYATYTGVIALCLLIFGRCPLTILEAKLRGRPLGGPGFVSGLAKKVGINIPDKAVNLVIWLLFAIAVVGSLVTA